MRLSRRLLMAAALAVSAFGAWYHNTREFPGMPLTAPEMLSAIVPAVMIAVWWLLRPGRILWWVTVVWVVLLNLGIGAIVTVLPLPFLPFEPEQTLGHYMTHLLYLLAQIPAIYLLLRWRDELREPAL
jgi:hypothetical protein